MKLWLIVPVKPFAESKSRLAPTLPNPARARLSRQLFHHVMGQATAAPVLAGILVVSRDATVLDGLPSSKKIALVSENGHDLNQAISQGRQAAVQQGADAILILPADLPRLQRDDITTLYERSEAAEGLIIVPSNDNGTNALLLRPPHAINFAFGRNSFIHHCRAAQLAQIPCTIHNAPHLAFDVDLPADLRQLATDHAYAAYSNASLPQAWR
jgi:2-phospho-L-lactate guanylyltransferase